MSTNPPKPTIEDKLNNIVNKHTGEWKAGHNHLIVEELLKAITTETTNAVLAELKLHAPDWAQSNLPSKGI